MKSIIYFLIICFLNPSMILAQNPKSICSQCGSFDLSKISFNENIDDLCSKANVTKTAIVNSYLEEKGEGYS